MRVFTILLCLSLTSRLAVAGEPGLLFHASYDEALDADFAHGSAKADVLPNARHPEPPRLVPGVLGRAVRVDRRGLKYAAERNLDASAGTILLWFQPVDWSGADDAMHFLFSTEMKPRCHMILYRYQRTKRNVGGIFGKFAFYLRGGSLDDPKHSLVIPNSSVSDSWQPGEWHHVAATWGSRQARLYVDGALVAQAAGKLPGQQPELFTVSANGGAGNVSNCIDELRIYDRVLPLSEILPHYVHGRRALVERAASLLAAQPTPDQLGQTLKVGCAWQDGLTKLLVRVDATELPVPDLAKLRLDVSVQTPNGGTAVPPVTASFSGLASALLTLDTSRLKPGSYRLQGSIRRDGSDEVLTTWSRDLTKPEAPWLGNAIGRSDEPCPPFEPVQVKGTRVAVWGKHYEVNDTLLLRQAVVRPDPRAALHRSVRRFWHDASLLAAPVRLVAEIDGTEVRLDTARVTAGDRDKVHATFETVAHLEGGEARATLRFDDDSIITADLQLLLEDAADIRGLRLEIPLRTEYCRWMNWTSLAGHRDASGAGAIPAGSGTVWQGVFHPLLWLGDDYRGFGYFCDTSRGWLGDLTAPDRVQIRRDGDVTTIVLWFVPRARLKAWQTRISFLATPARPMPRRWRGTCLGGNFQVQPIPHKEGCPAHVVYWWTTAFFEQKQSHYSSPRTDTLRLDAIRQAIAASADQPTSHVFYTYPNRYDHPIVPFFTSDWCNRSTEDFVSLLGQGDLPASAQVDWNSSVTDWWLWQMDRLADLGVDGIYCDDPYTHPSDNHRTGTAFVAPDGSVRANYGLYGLRTYFRRLRTLLHQKANHPHMLLHMSNQLTLPFQVYFDSFANGEHLNQRLQQHYIGELTPAEIRAQYVGYPWGNTPFILPELGSQFRSAPEPTEEMLALLLPHDVLIWVAWCHAATAQAYNTALQDEFRTWADDCSFLPYWEASDIVRGQDGTLVASAYVRDKAVLLVVANWSDADRDADLTLDWARLTDGRPMRSARVLLGKGDARFAGNRVSVRVPARNLRLLVLGP